MGHADTCVKQWRQRTMKRMPLLSNPIGGNSNPVKGRWQSSLAETTCPRFKIVSCHRRVSGCVSHICCFSLVVLLQCGLWCCCCVVSLMLPDRQSLWAVCTEVCRGSWSYDHGSRECCCNDLNSTSPNSNAQVSPSTGLVMDWLLDWIELLFWLFFPCAQADATLILNDDFFFTSVLVANQGSCAVGFSYRRNSSQPSQ